jgi:hypothetical protein
MYSFVFISTSGLTLGSNRRNEGPKSNRRVLRFFLGYPGIHHIVLSWKYNYLHFGVFIHTCKHANCLEWWKQTLYVAFVTRLEKTSHYVWAIRNTEQCWYLFDHLANDFSWNYIFMLLHHLEAWAMVIFVNRQNQAIKK